MNFRAMRMDYSKIKTHINNEVRILTEFQFNYSSANVTSVVVGGQFRRSWSNNNCWLFSCVRTWRPQGSNPNQYNLVPDSERTIYYSTNNVSTNGVFEYPLDPPIPVQSGDILAISQPPQGNSIFRVYYIQGVVNFDSYEVSLDFL